MDFYSKYKGEVFVANLAMAYDGNDLLLDSIQSCFFINLNFELLGIYVDIFWVFQYDSTYGEAYTFASWTRTDG